MCSVAPRSAPSAAPTRATPTINGSRWRALSKSARALRGRRTRNPNLNQSADAITERLNIEDIVWHAKWQEEERMRKQERAEHQADERKTAGAYTSIEYAPANNEVYRASLEKPAQLEGFWTTVVFVLVGAIVGCIGTAMKVGIENLQKLRFDVLFDTCDESPDVPFNVTTACTATLKPSMRLLGGAPAFAGISCALILLSGGLVAIVAPAAAASGLPEVIAFLNGTYQVQIFRDTPSCSPLTLRHPHSHPRPNPRPNPDTRDGTCQVKIFEMRTLLVKFVACLLAVGSGLPVGPEAPMIQ
jgi:chloride channel 7